MRVVLGGGIESRKLSRGRSMLQGTKEDCCVPEKDEVRRVNPRNAGDPLTKGEAAQEKGWRSGGGGSNVKLGGERGSLGTDVATP